MAQQSPQVRFRKQMRSFVFLWAGITFIMAAATFVAIYVTFPSIGGTGPSLSLQSVALPTETPTPLQPPTQQPTTTLSPAAEVTLPPTSQVTLDAAALAVAVIPTLAPTARPIDVRDFELGVQVQVSYDLMQDWVNVTADQLGVDWAKMQVRWENMEPEDGNYDWYETDLFIPEMADRGVKVLVSVVTAPEWAREPGVDASRHGPPADPAQYTEFVTALLERYPGQIHAVEVWNEQNLDREWTSVNGLSADNYVALLEAAHAAIKAVDPGIIVVSGALSPTGLSDGVRAWDDFVYLDQMIAAGLLDVADCIGVHHNGINVSPDYTWDAIPNDPTAQYRGPFDNPHHSWSFRSTLETYASKVQVAGGQQQLCVTEFGWPSAQGLAGVPDGLGFSYDNTLEEQRDYTVKALDFMSGSGDVRLAFLWNLNYGPQAGWSADNENVAYSVIGPDFAFRPVFDAVRDWNRAYEAGR
jgi:hypothetical protein